MSAAAPVAVVLVAMDDEAAPFLELATEVSDAETVGNAQFRRITLSDRPVVLVRSGIGFVNATSAGAGALFRHGASVPLISAGSAGGLAKDVAVGDVVLGTRLVNADADARAFGYALGQVPGMPEAYAAAPQLADAVRHARTEDVVLREGTIGSGEKFVTAELAARLRDDFPDLLAVDMESVALAQLCHSFGTDFVSVRAVSDLCAPDGTEFLTHVDDAAQRSASLVTAAIGMLTSSS
ncbi:5'-methylthioadenosine/S-adenosylhomocysteine nucleosidase [Promicromonospora thailandica]|uniref:adenosylhomocysteine nucleosidase n=1 Tax=Promicromonospora thailandica TaxID=765201 RepID=A0A9X2JXA4_9MICO|nr:5'-methylthioadenosine/S-adenosylhomocysteine nucleosidase [Promicromonospora thailandica]MCP2265998.1 adenosylhomocysteine nucleosidase [Promicromonospora thailandica]BFF21417.1 5'-methylthioadenosine/S-adenosylhomocysteine nucleosidase [Promicromonospora thailandica]